MFKGVSQCIPAVNRLYLVSSTPSVTLPYPFPPILPGFNGFQDISLCPLPVWVEVLLTIILFCFLISLEFHSIVPLLQTYSTCRCVHDHACVYIYLLDLSSAYDRKHGILSF
jgi:hypothetical protein